MSLGNETNELLENDFHTNFSIIQVNYLCYTLKLIILYEPECPYRYICNLACYKFLQNYNQL